MSTGEPIADVFAETVERLESFAALSSPSNDPDGLLAMAHELVGAFAAVGLSGRIELRQGTGGLRLPVVTAGRHDGPPALLLVGHLDTVLPAVPPRRDGDRLIATGAIDMKGGLAAFWGALRLRERTARGVPEGIALVVVPDEEVGGPIAHGVMGEHGAGAGAIWVLEPGAPDGDAETLVAARRGLLDWRLNVTGRGAHAGNQFWEGRSALLAAADWCRRAAALARPGDGPTVNPGRLVAGDASFVEDLAAQAERLGTPQQVNVVPNRAVVDGEARFLRPEEGASIRAELERLARAVASEHEVDADLAFPVTVPPLPPPRGAARRLADRAVSLAAARGWTLRIERDRGGISFPNFLPDPGAVAVLDGLGPVGGGMHTRDEFLSLGSLRRRMLLLADLLDEI